MSTKPSSASGRPVPGVGGGASANNSRRGSGTASPKPTGVGSNHNSKRPTSPASATPPPASSSSLAPLPDLSTLLNLPLRVVLAASGELGQREVEGTLWTYDPQTSFVVLTSPSPSSTTTTTTATAQNPPSTKRSYHLIKSTQIKSISILSLTPDTSLPSPSTPLGAINPAQVSARVEKAVLEDQKVRARLGQGVSEEAQALFDALGKTLPVRWAGRSIVVMDEVIINEPYAVGDVKGGQGASGYVERVKKVVSTLSALEFGKCGHALVC